MLRADFLRFRGALGAVTLALAAFALVTCAPDRGGPLRVPADDPAAADGVGSGYFTANAGQVDRDDVLYTHRNGLLLAGFLEDSVLLKIVEAPGDDVHRYPWEHASAVEGAAGPLPPADDRLLVDGVLIRLRFVGANAVRPEGRGRLPFPHHYIKGRDPAGWRTHVPNFAEVVYPDLYDGIDLVYRSGDEGLKYEFHVRPGADPSAIRIAYEGIEGLRVSPEGRLVARTAIGELLDAAPVSYAAAPGGAGSVPVESWYEVSATVEGEPSFRFGLDGWDGSTPLVIDPVVYSTFIGGKAREHIRTVAGDNDGFAVIGGWTISENFPTRGGAFQEEYNGMRDAFITKIQPGSKRLAFSTFLGGTELDDGYSLKLDRKQRIYITGFTGSTDFPVTDGSTFGGGRFDAFFAKLEDTGAELLFATYVGGSDDDWGYSIAVDPDENGYITGFTRSADFPVTAGAFDGTYGGLQDGFAAKIDLASGAVDWATYLGGRSVDFGWAVDVDAAGSAYVTGSSLSPDYPVTAGSFDETYNGGQDAVVTKLAPDGAGLVYSCFVGGSRFDRGHAIVLASDDSAIIGGVTESSNLPVTAGAFDGTYGGGEDGFVARIAPSGAATILVTYLGGSADEQVEGVAVNSHDDIFVAGGTFSPDFPTTAGAFDRTHNGDEDAFVSRFSPDGGTLDEGTFLGGDDKDRSWTITVAPDDTIYPAGEARSANFPILGKPFDKRRNGSGDGFLVKMVD